MTHPLQQDFDRFIFAVEEDLPDYLARKVADALGVTYDPSDFDLP